MKLKEIGEKYGTDKVEHDYLDFYEKELPKQVGKLLEIGVLNGASLRMWKEYYTEAAITWVDIKPSNFINGVELYCDDATKKDFARKMWMFDIIIDDGSHIISHQKKSFTNLWSHVNKGGCYIIEDIHTSFNDKEIYVDELPTTYDFIIDFCKKNDVPYKEKFKNENHWSWTVILFK
jgi:hypothetical protein